MAAGSKTMADDPRGNPSGPGDGGLSVTVRRPEGIVAELTRGMWVPTRRVLSLGDRVPLAIHLPTRSEPIVVEVSVVGRRMSRPGSVLSTGVAVRPTAPTGPAMALLADYIAADVVDLTHRRRDRLRRPANVSYASEGEAFDGLRALFEGGALVNLEGDFARGDRLQLAVAVHGEHIVNVDVKVQRLHLDRRETLVMVTALDATAQAQVLGAMAAVMARLRA